MPKLPSIQGVNGSMHDACIDLMDQVLDKMLQCRKNMSPDDIARVDSDNKAYCDYVDPLHSSSKINDCIDEVMSESCETFNSSLTYSCSALVTY